MSKSEVNTRSIFSLNKTPFSQEAKMPEGFEGRSGDLYDSGMGRLGPDIQGGQVSLDQGGPGIDHHTVYGDGGHFSWDRDLMGNVFGDHGTLHDPSRPW